MALDQAEALAGPGAVKGADVYVSLEPCAHHGRTPPCAHMLADAGVARLFAPFEDPDPRVSGRGFAALRSAGVTVSVGLMSDAARDVAAGFLTRQRLGRPRVVLKLAGSLDGRIAAATGESRWITGPAARRRVHLMRARADALLIGAGTARADDPGLDVRLPGLTTTSPVRVVADPSLSLPLTSKLAETAHDRPLWLLAGPAAMAARREAFVLAGAEVLPVDVDDTGALRLSAALTTLAERGVTSVLCEGGGRISASLIREDLVDEIAWFTGGLTIGGDGLPSLEALGVTAPADAPRFSLARIEDVEGDTLAIWRRAEAAD
jgi:diaminohydroxyphosphoribosylaminopyrimidine deaminase/5-amino-6-(5-phosphoribosylamino)uracil reductase